MASVLPESSVGPATRAFTEALNGLAVGLVSPEFVRRALEQALQEDPGCLPAIQALVEEAFHEGRLTPADHEALFRVLGLGLGEDPPTEWSEDVVNEAAPASDTARPAPPVADPDASLAQAAPLYPGAVLRNRFVLQARLKATGMSEVFKALDRRRQEAGAEDPWIAIKLVAAGGRHAADALRLLQQEAALAQRLHHPHIVRVFDFDRDGDYAFLTMEWLEGESLGDLLTRQRYRPLTPAYARQVIAEIGDALEFAHSRGITHADVKPGNIFITRDGLAKLLDFGIARDGGQADPGADARTPAYASCEVLEGARPTPQDDVYSLACVAYRMLSGRRAHGHHDALAAERAGRRPTPIRALTGAQWAALERALAFRRAGRTPDMATFMRDFIAAAPAGYATAAGAAPHPQPAPAAPARRRPLALGLAAAGAALAVAVLFWPAPPAKEPAPAMPTIAGTAPPQAGPVPASPPAPLPPPAPVAPVRAADAGARSLPAPNTARPARAETTPARRPRAPAASRPRGEPQAPPVAGTPDLAERSGPIPAERVALNGTLLPDTPAAPPEPATGAPAASGAPPAAPPSGTPAPAATTREVLLTDLKFTRYVEPKDRRDSRLGGPAGWVQVAFTVGADGVPRDIDVVESSPPGRYESASVAAVKRWRFEPVMEDGAAVERRTAVRLRFQPE